MRGEGKIRKMGNIKVKQYFSYKRLNNQAVSSGNQYSIKKYFLSFVAMCTVTMATGIFYGLKPLWLMVVAVAGIICVPALTAAFFSEREKKKRFNDVDIYIHQMIYSFERQPKIIMALEDTLKITSGKMHRCIEMAVRELEYGTTRDVYQQALAVIEKEYSCSRIITLHSFLIQVEEKGGRYENSLGILLSDADNWVKRIYKFQEDIKRVKQTSAIGVVLSFLMASVSVLITFIMKNTSQICLDITGEPLYQMVSSAFLIFCIAYYTYIQVKYDCDWLVKQRSDKMVQRDYNLVFHTDTARIRKAATPIYAVVILAACILGYMKFYLWMAVLLLIAFYLVFVPVIHKAEAFNRLKKDLYYAFADWLRDVALNLSEESLQMAIEDTYDTCPIIMKESLEEFIFSIEENPSDVTPYYAFLNMFHVLDISSSVRILYSLSENDAESVDATIHTLIRRNYELMDKYEDTDNQDKISMMRFAEYIPTFFVSIKVAADMMLVIANYL